MPEGAGSAVLLLPRDPAGAGSGEPSAPRKPGAAPGPTCPDEAAPGGWVRPLPSAPPRRGPAGRNRSGAPARDKRGRGPGPPARGCLHRAPCVFPSGHPAAQVTQRAAGVLARGSLSGPAGSAGRARRCSSKAVQTNGPISWRGPGSGRSWPRLPSRPSPPPTHRLSPALTSYQRGAQHLPALARRPALVLRFLNLRSQ